MILLFIDDLWLPNKGVFWIPITHYLSNLKEMEQKCFLDMEKNSEFLRTFGANPLWSAKRMVENISVCKCYVPCTYTPQ